METEFLILSSPKETYSRKGKYNQNSSVVCSGTRWHGRLEDGEQKSFLFKFSSFLSLATLFLEENAGVGFSCCGFNSLGLKLYLIFTTCRVHLSDKYVKGFIHLSRAAEGGFCFFFSPVNHVSRSKQPVVSLPLIPSPCKYNDHPRKQWLLKCSPVKLAPC